MNILTVIMVLILLILLARYFKNYNTERLESKLYNGNKWANYRIGDVFYNNMNSKFYDDSFDENVLYHKNEYPGTIASEYINLNTEGTNYNLLRRIIESRITDKKTYPDILFLHIRVGDVLCKKTNWLNKVNGPLYYSKVGDDQWWDNVRKYILLNNINKVVIISGSHMNNCLTESVKYIENRKNYFENVIPGIKVEYRLGQSPDDDILLVYYAKHFITTGGGYGNMIKEIKK